MIEHLRRAVPLREGAGLADGQLLGSFIERRDEAALTALVKRHGPMVWGVCRRLLSHHDAEDAFQATFLVLVRKAVSIVPRELVGNFLYGVAHQAALQARRTAARRRAREVQVMVMPDTEAVQQDQRADVQPLLDQELSRLPDNYRAVIVLCDLEGRTRKQVTRQLGVPEGTVAGRLARARAILAKRLTQRGVTLSGGTLAAVIAQQPAAGVPTSVVSNTISAASSFAAGPAAATGPVSVKIAALTEGVLKAMLLNKLKTVTTVLFVALGMVVFGGGLYLHQAEAQQGPADKSPAASQTDENEGEAPREKAQGPNKIMVLRASHLTLLDPDGKNARKVGEDKLHMLGARLSPDGKKVGALFQTPQKELVPPPPPGEQKGEVKLFVCELEKKQSWTDLGVMCRFFAWSADGTEIACSDCTDELYPQFNNGPNMKSPEATHFVVNVATKQKTALKLSKDHVITDWSRDGKLFLTTSVDGRAGEKVARMHLMSRNGTEHRALTDGKQPAMFGRLSPDGKRVLYCTPLTAPEPESNKRYKLGLDVLDIASGKVDRVQESGDIYSYCWSPDAKRIAYAWREWNEGEFIDLLSKEHKCYLVVCHQDGKNRKTIATETGRSPATIAINPEDWQQGDKPLVKVPQKQEQTQEKEAFTAWGEEVGGLQAGVGFLPGKKRTYYHGETVTLVYRVRNVGKKEVKFEYLKEFFMERPFNVTDGDGKPVPQEAAVYMGAHLAVEVNLAPGKEIELYENRLELKPGNKASPHTLWASGKVSLWYERLFGNTSAGQIKLDPTLSKLATGKVELEIKSDPFATPGKESPQKQDREDANLKPIKIGVYIEKVNVDTSTITASCVLIGEVDNVTKPLRFENLRVAEKATITARGKEVKLTDLQLLPRDTPFYLFLKAYEFGGFEVVGIETIRK
jgi:RNA polymerase sigma factor (sigma-70 family)